MVRHDIFFFQKQVWFQIFVNSWLQTRWLPNDLKLFYGVVTRLIRKVFLLWTSLTTINLVARQRPSSMINGRMLCLCSPCSPPNRHLFCRQSSLMDRGAAILSRRLESHKIVNMERSRGNSGSGRRKIMCENLEAWGYLRQHSLVNGVSNKPKGQCPTSQGSCFHGK